jgi:hypothetical protein
VCPALFSAATDVLTVRGPPRINVAPPGCDKLSPAP